MKPFRIQRGLALWSIVACSLSAPAQTVLTVHAAGSLRAALTEVAQAFEVQTPGSSVRLVFGASGLLKDRLQGGEASDVFASANMEHPQALVATGRAESANAFARNALCGLSKATFELQGDTLVARLLDPRVRIGISTPRADPSGDYAFQMFERVESAGVGPTGSAEVLKGKALQLTGGPNSAPPPADRNIYGVLVVAGAADMFITYCTSAAVAAAEQPTLKVWALPATVNVSAQYGIAVLRPVSAQAQRFVDFVLGERGQRILAAQGFAPP
jgi:molybdate transport system substrate-binding protein